jgi:hypothetical protein
MSTTTPTPTLETAAPVEATRSETPLLDQIAAQQAQTAARYKPVLSVTDAQARYEQLRWYIEHVMQEGVDYGRIPGVDKPFLFKPGAQGLCTFFGYVPFYETIQEIEDWSGKEHNGEPLFYYKYKCVLMRDDARVGEGIGSANSWESKYRYRWLRDDQLPAGVDKASLPARGGKQTLFAFDFAIDKAETTGQYGKPAEYWQAFRDAIENGTGKWVEKPFKSGKPGKGVEMTIDATLYRMPNDSFPDVINTTQKQGTKRAYIEATLSATGASRFFTQDEDEVEAMNAPPPHTKPAEQQPAKPAAANGTERTPQTNRVIPEELSQIIARMKKEPTQTNVKQAFRVLEDALVDKVGTVAGVEIYKRVVEAFEAAVPAKSRKIGDVVECLVDLWEALQKAERPAEVQA